MRTFVASVSLLYHLSCVLGLAMVLLLLLARPPASEACLPSPFYYPQQPYATANPYSSPVYTEVQPAYGYGDAMLPPPYSAASKSRMASDTHKTVDNSLDPMSSEPGPHHDQMQQCVQQRLTNKRLDCVPSMERRVPSTESECERLCLENPLKLCRAYQFDSIGMACDLFDAAATSFLPSTSSFPTVQADSPSPTSPDRQIEADDDDLTAAVDSTSFHSAYKRHRRRRFVLHNGVHSATERSRGRDSQQSFAAPVVQADVAGPSPSAPPLGANLLGADPLGLSTLFKSPLLNLGGPTQCESRLQPAIGTTVTTVNTACTSTISSNALFPQPSPFPFTGGVEPFSSKSSSSAIEPFGSLVVPGGGTTLMVSDCADGFRPRIQLIDGISILGTESMAKIEVGSPDICLQLCRNNAHLDGAHLSAPCKAATYDRANGRCTIFHDAISPNGELNYVPHSETIYFEKLCIPEVELPAGCNDVINRIPQHALESRAAGTGAVASARTQIECIRRCITSQKALGFECASASYFFDRPSDNCYLSRFTRMIRPDLYAADQHQLVDYMELPPCMRRERQHDDVKGHSTSSSSSQSRSECNGTSTSRHDCTNCQSTKRSFTLCNEQRAHSRDFSKQKEVFGKDTKKIATTLEAIQDSMRQVGREQDTKYEDEISFFGPPQKASKQSAASSRAAFELEPSPGNAFNIGDKDAFKAEMSPEKTTLVKEKSLCDPKSKCCPHPNADLKTLVRGCSMGIRTLSDGRSVSCMTEECHR